MDHFADGDETSMWHQTTVDMKLIGEGVHRVYATLIDGKSCVKKQFVFDQGEVSEGFTREVNALRTLAHQHIVPLLAVSWQSLVGWVALPRYQHTLFEARMNIDPEWEGQLESAVSYAHDCGFTHRDLKPSNVMISFTGDAVLCDWDASVYTGDKLTEIRTNPICSLPYRAPELLWNQSDMEYDPYKLDLWSLGCVLWFMRLGKAPFEGHDEGSLLAVIMMAVDDVSRGTITGVPSDLTRFCNICPDQRTL